MRCLVNLPLVSSSPGMILIISGMQYPFGTEALIGSKLIKGWNENSMHLKTCEIMEQ